MTLTDEGGGIGERGMEVEQLRVLSDDEKRTARTRIEDEEREE